MWATFFPFSLSRPDLTGMIHGEQRQLELVLLGQLLQRRVGFPAVRAVVVDVGDLLPLQLIPPRSDRDDPRRAASARTRTSWPAPPASGWLPGRKGCCGRCGRPSSPSAYPAPI